MFDRQDLIPEEEIRSSEQEPHAESADADRNQPMLAGMRCDLRGWGIALIGIGIAQYFIPFLDSMWAFVVVPLGALSLFLAHRGLFIAIGTALVVIGILNIFSGGFGLWMAYGVAQIYWGVQEIRKFGKYADAK
jgi:hypothetical protein